LNEFKASLLEQSGNRGAARAQLCALQAESCRLRAKCATPPARLQRAAGGQFLLQAPWTELEQQLRQRELAGG